MTARQSVRLNWSICIISRGPFYCTFVFLLRAQHAFLDGLFSPPPSTAPFRTFSRSIETNSPASRVSRHTSRHSLSLNFSLQDRVLCRCSAAGIQILRWKTHPQKKKQKTKTRIEKAPDGYAPFISPPLDISRVVVMFYFCLFLGSLSIGETWGRSVCACKNGERKQLAFLFLFFFSSWVILFLLILVFPQSLGFGDALVSFVVRVPNFRLPKWKRRIFKGESTF